MYIYLCCTTDLQVILSLGDNYAKQLSFQPVMIVFILKMTHVNNYDKIIRKQSKQFLNKIKLLLAQTFAWIKMSSMYPKQSMIQNSGSWVGSWDKPNPDLPTIIASGQPFPTQLIAAAPCSETIQPDL